MDEAFVEAYFQIDKNMKGEITKAQLEEYRKEHNYDEGFVNKWLNLFDRKRTGKISLGEFSRVLGLDPKHILEVQKSKLTCKLISNGQIEDELGGVEVITVDMEEPIQNRIIQLVREAKSKNVSDRMLVKQLKLTLDQEYGRLWQVILVQGQYWSYFSHEPRFNFVFKMGSQIYVTWKVPYL
ncbi:hypothetical protein Ciccas_010496 [Cichlidogyrus casuarinus]|uniref:EF-hand domain-containing protein n=1 Tax=Cichlidogyrus casuarinus TaxID=1844966 RepID=A0ABD2PWW4_9PLAT